jgi:hypothetical protein
MLAIPADTLTRKPRSSAPCTGVRGGDRRLGPPRPDLTTFAFPWFTTGLEFVVGVILLGVETVGDVGNGMVHGFSGVESPRNGRFAFGRYLFLSLDAGDESNTLDNDVGATMDEVFLEAHGVADSEGSGKLVPIRLSSPFSVAMWGTAVGLTDIPTLSMKLVSTPSRRRIAWNPDMQ